MERIREITIGLIERHIFHFKIYLIFTRKRYNYNELLDESCHKPHVIQVFLYLFFKITAWSFKFPLEMNNNPWNILQHLPVYQRIM